MDESERVLSQIRECDRMYSVVQGRRDGGENVCKKLLSMGFDLNTSNLPELCIIHCGRWNLEQARN
jgi:Fe2+ transport system protein FeoA